MASCGIGVSQAPDAGEAAREAVGEALSAFGPGPARSLLLFATTAHDDPRPLIQAARDVSDDLPLAGCVASGVLSHRGEIEEGFGVVAAALGDAGRPFSVSGLGDASVEATSAERGVALVFADGYSMHPEVLLSLVQEKIAPRLPLCGGVAVGAEGPGPAYRFCHGEITSSGASGMILSLDDAPVIGLAHACCPVGRALTVTAAQGNVLESLDDEPAFAAFAEVARPFLDDLPRAAQSIFLAVPAGEHGPDDPVEEGYVVRGLLKFDPDRGLLAASEPIPVGSRLRFAFRNALGGRERFRDMVERSRVALGGRRPRYGLYFNCAGRGQQLFGVPDHDVAFLHDALGEFPLAGIFGGGQIGPSRGVPRLHLFSGVLVLVP